MSTLGKQLRQGLGDAGKAVSTDVVKGLAEGVMRGVVGEGGETSRVTDVQNRADDQEQEKLERMRSEQAARRRLGQLRNELAGVTREREERRSQDERREEAERVVEEQEESGRKKRLREWLLRMRRGGGTGEVVKQKG